MKLQSLIVALLVLILVIQLYGLLRRKQDEEFVDVGGIENTLI